MNYAPLLLRYLVFASTLWTTTATASLAFSVAEESPVGTVVGVVAHSESPGISHQQLRYRIRSSSSSAVSSGGRYFQLDEFTGLLRTAELLDREELCPYEPYCQLVVDVIGKYFWPTIPNNGRAYTTSCRLSVVCLSVTYVLWLNGTSRW